MAVTTYEYTNNIIKMFQLSEDREVCGLQESTVPLFQ